MCVCVCVCVCACVQNSHIVMIMFRFRKNKIDGVALLKLDASALTELGVTVCVVFPRFLPIASLNVTVLGFLFLCLVLNGIIVYDLFFPLFLPIVLFPIVAFLFRTFAHHR